MHSEQQLAKAVISFYWRHIKVYRRYVIWLVILLPVTVLVNQILPPIILADVISRLGSGEYDKSNIWGSFGPQLIVFAILQLSGGLVIWRCIDYVIWRLEANVQRDIGRQVFDHLTSETADFHANNFGGSLVSQTNKLLTSYARIMDTTVFGVIPLILGVLFSVIVLAKTAWVFSILLLAFAIIYAVSAIFVTRRVRELSVTHAALQSRQTGMLSDAITNVMAIKSFAGSQYERRRFADTTDNTRDGLLQLATAHQKQQLFFSGMIGSIGALSLLIAVVSVFFLNADVAAVFLIFSYTTVASQQLFQFSNAHLRNYNRSIGDAGAMVQTLSKKPSIKDPLTPIVPKINHGKIRFNAVVFKHDGADKPIFNDLQLTVKAGEKIGLVGHSGSGKTSLTRVLLRFSDIQSGAISIDGYNIAEMAQDDLHRHIAYVPQEPLLFHRSIAENIRYADPDATDQAVRKAAKMASADSFISALPNGYETLVGERGVKLSGGQRQRVAIARALLKDAPILVLDEATSALDSESEVLIQRALGKLMEHKTTIVIAHRLSTIQKMDRIIVLSQGQIIEQGSHKQLVAADGTYAQLWSHQSGGFIHED